MPNSLVNDFLIQNGTKIVPKWSLQTSETMLGVERQHDFQKISDSAIYLHFRFKITSQNNLLDAPMALKTRPKRLKSAPRRS